MRRTWLFVPGADDAAHAAVRINPLEGDGRTDLESILPAQPDIVLMPKVVSSRQVEARVDGKLVGVPIYAAAKLLLASAGRTKLRQRKKRG